MNFCLWLFVVWWIWGIAGHGLYFPKLWRTSMIISKIKGITFSVKFTIKEYLKHLSSFGRIQCRKIRAHKFYSVELSVMRSMHLLKFIIQDLSSEFRVHWTARCCDISIAIRQSRLNHLPCNDLGRVNYSDSIHWSIKQDHCHLRMESVCKTG